MSILVTGASGILGRPLVRQLLGHNQTIIGLCRTPPATHEPGLSWLSGDVSKPHLGLNDQDWQRLTAEVTEIFHLAARTDFKGRSLDDYRAINIGGVNHIKELALASGAWLHHVSTAFVCGEWPDEFLEDQLQEGQSFHNFYEESKYLGECALRQDPAPDFTVYRPAIILERKPTAKSQSVFGPFVFLDGVFRICLGLIKRGETTDTLYVEGNPAAHLPFVFDDEVAKVLYQLSLEKSAAHKTFHLTPTRPFPNHLLEKIFNESFGRQAVHMGNDSKPTSTAERILAKKTAKYRPYMNLATTFSRINVDTRFPKALAAINEEELLAAFSLFLATKKELSRVVNHDEAFHLDQYFNHFLQQHTGKPLIKNLSSLSASLHIEISGHTTWTITIDKGVLTEITEGRFGTFGYRTDATTFLEIAKGQLSPQQGFFKGAIQLIANPKEALRTATALEEFFREYPYIQPENNHA